VYLGRMAGAAGFVRTVAIKRLHPHLAEEPDFVSMMIDEARLAARVQHPNVAQTLDVVTEDGELLVVMEYVAGESLARLLRVESSRQRHVPFSISSAVISGALQGLHAAHEARSDQGEPLGIVHRDVSPHNVLVGVDGMPRVIDFGVAKAVGRLQTTRAGVVKGKVPYMAPEHLAGAETTRMADIYAAGVVLWETLTGRRLHRAEDDAMLLAQVLAGATERPSRYVGGVPPALDAVVMRALAHDPADRFQTAREFSDALVRAMPPAMPTDVGAWVEDVARQVLDARSAQLAEIESHSSLGAPVSARVSVSTAHASISGLRSGPRRALGPPQPAAAEDDLPTVASQPSAASQPAMDWPAAVPPAPLLPSQSPDSPAKLWLIGGAAGALVFCAGMTLVLTIGRSPTTEEASEPVASAVPLPVPTPTPTPTQPLPDTATAPAIDPPPPEEIPSSTASAAPTPHATTNPWAAPRPLPPPPPARPTVPPVRKPTPSPAGSVIFATPD
jgi:hypothetical protein